MNSFTVVTGSDGWTARMFWKLETLAIGAMSLRASYGVFISQWFPASALPM